MDILVYVQYGDAGGWEKFSRRPGSQNFGCALLLRSQCDLRYGRSHTEPLLEISKIGGRGLFCVRLWTSLSWHRCVEAIMDLMHPRSAVNCFRNHWSVYGKIWMILNQNSQMKFEVSILNGLNMTLTSNAFILVSWTFILRDSLHPFQSIWAVAEGMA